MAILFKTNTIAIKLLNNLIRSMIKMIISLPLKKKFGNPSIKKDTAKKNKRATQLDEFYEFKPFHSSDGVLTNLKNSH
jgi:hypothetical protein